MPASWKWILTVAAVVSALSGCVDLKPPRDVGGSRSNVGEQLPAFIVEGKTTRDDVLLQIGEPDERGYFDRWFVYQSQRSFGGAAVGIVPGLVAGAEAVRYRRIVVSFDDAGVVAKASFVEQEQVESFYLDVPPKRRMDAGSEVIRDRFPGAVYRLGGRWSEGAVDITNQAVVFWVKPEPGSDNRVLIRLPAETIAGVRWGAEDASQGGRTALVARVDGGIDVFAFRPLAGNDPAESGAFDQARTGRFVEGVKALQSKLAR